MFRKLVTAQEAFKIYDTLIQVKPNKQKDKVVGLFFIQPSTRTFYSFMSAAQRLGCSVLPISGTQGLSIEKGETVQSTLETLAIYCDLLVVRGVTIPTSLPIPVINAGDDCWHPTQALADYYVSSKYLHNSNKWRVKLAGDLGWNRTNRTYIELTKLLHPDTELTQDDNCDILYITRPQSGAKFSKVTWETLSRIPSHTVVLHPLPHCQEIDVDCLDHPQVKVKEQMETAYNIRMKLLSLFLTEN